MNHKLLLFDIDGTLLLSGGAGMRAMLHVAGELFGDSFKWDGIETAGMLDPIIFAAAAEINQLQDHDRHHEMFHDRYIERLSHELHINRDKVQVMPGIHDALATLRRRASERGDIVLGLLTGNYTKAVPLKLRAIDVDPAWFEITAFGDEGKTRPDLVAVAMKRYEQRYHQQIEPRNVIVIGDTHRDVHCAKAHGCLAFAVATGGVSLDELREAGADVAVNDLTDLSPLLAMLDG